MCKREKNYIGLRKRGVPLKRVNLSRREKELYDHTQAALQPHKLKKASIHWARRSRLGSGKNNKKEN